VTAPQKPVPKRRGHPGVAPWQSLPSLRAGLPHDRAGWLAVVLPAIDAGRSHPEAARLLTESGHKVDAKSVQLWHRKLGVRAAPSIAGSTTASHPARSCGRPARREGSDCQGATPGWPRRLGTGF
jgi:hypothetical protein